MSRLLARYPLAAFFGLAYLGSWVMWSPWYLARNGIGVLPFDLPLTAVAGVNQLGLFAGPFAAALLMTRITEGRDGRRRFWRRIVQWRAHPGWYVLALLIIPVATGLGYLLGSGAEGGSGGPAALGLLAGTYLMYLIGGPFQEEPGWRGFALPRLQQRLHPVAAAFVLGVIHCCWHAPLFLTDEWDTARQDPSQYAAYFLLVVSLSFVLSWLANGSRGSVLLVILGHNSLNWALYGTETLTGREVVSNWPAAIGLAVLAVIAVVVTRGRLGQPRARQ
ncbi:CPBP family intramembrane glutamic endopeptidase [Enemella sp. A6]|uniref:CPBP family intramembrane glutamic endopeptidase n=1 Tax=Enemella sp. A6 TaxID=3440152 RepID=UPI003EBDB5F3